MRDFRGSVDNDDGTYINMCELMLYCPYLTLENRGGDFTMEFLELLHLILGNIVDGAILLFEFIGVGIIIFSGLRGVVVRDWKEIGTVAGIIALRAALTFLIHWEIKEEEKEA